MEYQRFLVVAAELPRFALDVDVQGRRLTGARFAIHGDVHAGVEYFVRRDREAIFIVTFRAEPEDFAAERLVRRTMLPPGEGGSAQARLRTCACFLSRMGFRYLPVYEPLT